MKDIYWICNDDRTKLAIVSRPRGDDWLETDLARLKDNGIDGIVSLLTAPELDELGLMQEAAFAQNLGLSFFSFPIPDRHVPHNTAEFSQFIAAIAEHVKRGQAIGIHCRGCIGRATITAASLLVNLGWKADTALEEIKTARGCPVPDTLEQRAWILALTPPHSTQ